MRSSPASRVASVALIVASSAWGISAGAQSRGDRVVATFGDASLTVAEVEARLARIPPFRLRELGATIEEQRKRALDQLLDVELLAMAARQDKLDERDDVAMRIRRAHVSALEATLREEALRNASVTDDDVKAFYDKNRSRYAAENRLKIWQIVLRTREDADKVLGEIAADKDWNKDAVGKWEDLARKWSIDKSTSMKRGNLGFVTEDGATQDHQVRVNPALFAAADRLGDGEIAKEPVQDGDAWVIVSRRGTMRTPERSLESEAPTIRSMLARQKLTAELQAILEGLRRAHVTEMHPERLGDVNIDVAGAVSPARRPGALPRLHRADRVTGPRAEGGALR